MRLTNLRLHRELWAVPRPFLMVGWADHDHAYVGFGIVDGGGNFLLAPFVDVLHPGPRTTRLLDWIEARA